MKRTRFIGVSGGSCSGKTMFAERLSWRLGGGLGGTPVVSPVGRPIGCPVISTDSYYLGLPNATHKEVEQYNFDDPAALDHQMLAGHLTRLALERVVDIPVYDFSTHTRGDHVRRVEPAAFVIVEGLFSLYWREIRTLLDTKVFLDVPHDQCLARRIKRDTRERGRSREEIVQRYDTMARPTYEKYVLPSRAYADVVLDGTRPVDEGVEAVVRVIDERMV